MVIQLEMIGLIAGIVFAHSRRRNVQLVRHEYIHPNVLPNRARPADHAGGGTAITGLADGTTYYVKAKTTNDFEISLTAGGASVAFDKNNAGNAAQFFEKMLYMPEANVGVRCVTCAVGKYVAVANGKTKGSCDDCAAGKSAPAQSAACTACAAGKAAAEGLRVV